MGQRRAKQKAEDNAGNKMEEMNWFACDIVLAAADPHRKERHSNPCQCLSILSARGSHCLLMLEVVL